MNSIFVAVFLCCLNFRLMSAMMSHVRLRASHLDVKVPIMAALRRQSPASFRWRGTCFPLRRTQDSSICEEMRWARQRTSGGREVVQDEPPSPSREETSGQELYTQPIEQRSPPSCRRAPRAASQACICAHRFDDLAKNPSSAPLRGSNLAMSGLRTAVRCQLHPPLLRAGPVSGVARSIVRSEPGKCEQT